MKTGTQVKVLVDNSPLGKKDSIVTVFSETQVAYFVDKGIVEVAEVQEVIEEDVKQVETDVYTTTSITAANTEAAEAKPKKGKK